MTTQEIHPAITSDMILAMDEQYHLPVFKRFPVVFKEGRGARLWDVDGKEYIDAMAGIAVNSVGHAHPKLVKAIADQVASLIHICNSYLSEPQAKLAQKLAALSGLQYAFFCNSGAEAVEGAMKVARKYAHAHGRGGTIITVKNAFHGRTMAAVAATGKASMMAGFEPIPAGYLQVPANDLEAIEALATNDIAAVMLETVQGEGGIIPMDKSYLQSVHQLCTEHNIVLILDEIQCGMGRTGAMFAFEHYGVMPDIMPLAKALGGGVPIGAFLVSEKMAKVMKPGDHGSTFGGNPLACAAALATIGIIEEELLIEAAQKKGDYMLSKINELRSKCPLIKEVRGIGLMIGVELTAASRPFVEKMLRKGVMANATADTVIRLVPPLVISYEEIDMVIDTMREVLCDG